MSHPDAIDWSLYRSFLAVLRHGSLSAAARQLGVAQPTVGRHIDALETALGVALFTRTQHGYQPTALAEALRSQAEALGHQVAALQRLARSRADDVAGVVRITASQTLGVAALPGILAQLTRDWPQLRFELDLDNALHDLLQRQSDLAVRLIPPVQAGLVARKVGQLALGFFAQRRYIEAHGVPADLAALSRHRLIGLRDMPDWLARSAQGVQHLVIRAVGQAGLAHTGTQRLGSPAVLLAGQAEDPAIAGWQQNLLEQRGPQVRGVVAGAPGQVRTRQHQRGVA